MKILLIVWIILLIIIICAYVMRAGKSLYKLGYLQGKIDIINNELKQLEKKNYEQLGLEDK